AHATPALACAAADPDHPRPARLLARIVGSGQGGDEGTLPAPSLARRYGLGGANHASQAARMIGTEARRGCARGNCAVSCDVACSPATTDRVRVSAPRPGHRPRL